MSRSGSLKTIPEDQPFLDMLELVKYTMQITQGKVFYLKPPMAGKAFLSEDEQINEVLQKSAILVQRHPLAERIDKLACSIYEKAWHTYGTLDNQVLILISQTEILKRTDDLLGIMQIAKAVFHLSAKRMLYWTSLVMKVESSYTDYCTKLINNLPANTVLQDDA